jgi:hypothetical protein
LKEKDNMNVTTDWKLTQIAKNGKNKDEFKRDIEALISDYRLTERNFAGTTAGIFAGKEANTLQKKLLQAEKGITLERQ